MTLLTAGADVMFEVLSIWRDAICLEAAPALKAICAAATGGFSVLVMGAEIVMILLAAAIACKNFCLNLLLGWLMLCCFVQSAHAVAGSFLLLATVVCKDFCVKLKLGCLVLCCHVQSAPAVAGF